MDKKQEKPEVMPEKPAEKHARKDSHKAAKRQETATPSKKVIYGIIAAVVLIGIVLFFTLRSGSSKTVATVNGEDLTEKDVQDYFNRIPPQYRQNLQAKDVVDQVVDERLLLQEASKQGIIITQEEVKQRVQDSLAKSGVGQDKLTETLKAQGLTLDDLVIAFQHQLIISKLMDTLGGVNVTEQQAQDFYANNKQQMFTNTTFAEVKDQLIKAMTSQLQQKMLQEYITQLRQKAAIEMK